jgi:hypothetical protein
LSDKAKIEGKKYEDPYLTLLEKVKHDKIILYAKIEEEIIETKGIDF